jgi:hypothetical protein
VGMEAPITEACGPQAAPPPPCPWCGSATQLELRGDGMGQVAMRCNGCGASGPGADLRAGFDAADQRATLLWSGRRMPRPIARETINRVGTALRLHTLAGPLDPTAMIGVAWQDLDSLVRSAVVAEPPRR